MKRRFIIRQFDYVVDYEAADSILTCEESWSGDVREALEVLRSQVWDNLDEREQEVICYPADWDTDMRTGEVTHTDVAIQADNPRNLARLLALYRKES